MKDDFYGKKQPFRSPWWMIGAAVLLIAVAGYAVDAVYQRLYRLLRLPALETKLDALTACILQRIVGSEKA